MDHLARWRDDARLPLVGPNPIALGRSAPDFFSRPRRAHDLAVAVAALGLVAVAEFAIVAARRRRRSMTPVASA